MPTFAYPLGIGTDDGFAVGEKLRVYVNVSSQYDKSSKYEEVGVVRNESDIAREVTMLEYDDGQNDWLAAPRKERIEVNGAFMIHKPETWAIAMGLTGVTSSTSTAYTRIDSDGTLTVAPKYPWKFVSERVNGKDLELWFVAGQIVTASQSFSFGGDGAVEIPFTIRAMIKSNSTIGYKKYRMQFAK